MTITRRGTTFFWKLNLPHPCRPARSKNKHGRLLAFAFCLKGEVDLGYLLQGQRRPPWSPASSFCCQDVDDRWSLQFPQLYVPGQQNLYFNKKEFAKCTLYSIYSSLVLFLVPYGTTFNSVRSDGRDVADYQSFALIVQTCLLIVVSVQVGRSVSPTAPVLWPQGSFS